MGPYRLGEKTRTMNYYEPLLADNLYHVFSRAIGNEKLFLEDKDYAFFLEKFDKYIYPVADTFAWSLLPNHFHFLIQVRPVLELLSLFKKTKPSAIEYDGWQAKFVMQQFSNMLNSYAKSFNKYNNRKGGLFMDYMRRVEIKTQTQLTTTVFYIHKNSVHHRYCSKIADWPWSSYNIILSNEPTKLQRQKLLNWFGNTEKFIAYHNQPIYLKNKGPNL